MNSRSRTETTVSCSRSDVLQDAQPTDTIRCGVLIQLHRHKALYLAIATLIAGDSDAETELPLN